MEEFILTMVKSQGLAYTALVGWGYFMLKYFMQVVEKKDSNMAETINRFIDLQKESNMIHNGTGELLKTLTTKLEAVHTDVKKLLDEQPHRRS